MGRRVNTIFDVAFFMTSTPMKCDGGMGLSGRHCMKWKGVGRLEIRETLHHIMYVLLISSLAGDSFKCFYSTVFIN